MNNTPNNLYHYTTAQGLLGIIEKNELWASNLRCMNDQSELQYTIDLVENMLREKVRDGFPHLPKETWENILGRFESFDNAYSCCFCEERDQLSQWRAYSQKGTGYSIGFDIRELSRIQTMSNQSIILASVFYDRKTHIQTITPLIESFLKNISSLIENPTSLDPSQSKTLYRDAFDKFVATAFDYVFFFKNPVFIEEKEQRLVTIIHDATVLNFRETQGMVVPYIKLVYPSAEPNKNNKLPIVEIIQGPLIDTALGEKALRLLLKKHSYENVNVISSKVPLRL
jgi:hypothetical protein